MGKIDELTNEASAMQKPVSDIAERGGSGAIAQLIQQYCPDGVEYVKLGELCVKVCSGGTPSRGNGDYFMGNIPWLRTQEVNWNDIYDTEIKITEEAVNNSSAKIIPTNCVIIAMYGATAGKVGINKIPLTTNQACCNLQINSQKALYKYVYYCVCNEYENIKSLGQGSQNNINAQIVKDYPIPLPPLPVQEAIVNILDRFAVYAAELQAELQARQQQYNYYRDTLLSFEGREDVQWVKLGEVCSIKARIGWQRLNKSEYLSTGNYYLVTGVDIRGTRVDFQSCYYVSKERYDMDTNIQLKNGDIILTKDGTIGKVALIEEMDKPGVLNSHLFVIRDTSGKLTAKYLMYILLSKHFQMFVDKNKTQGTIPGLNQATVVKFELPIPSLSEQQRIVDILDRFDTLTNDLSQGLPAEIEARQQQYEYYRDKLLTFKKKEA